MQVTLFTVAEYASVSMEGKLTLGGFLEAVHCDTLPLLLPPLYSVAQLRVFREEIGAVFQLKITLQTPQGEAIFSQEENIQVQAFEHGQRILLNKVIQISQFVAQQTGDYIFTLYINNNAIAQQPLEILMVPPAVDTRS